MPFPVPGTVITKRGVSAAQITDGTSTTMSICESREELTSSWYSGRASYCVAHWPQSPATTRPAPVMTGTTGQPSEYPAAGQNPGYWVSDFPAINKGSSVLAAQYYNNQTPHGKTIQWGPSSKHDRVVVHGFVDGHADAIRDDIDGDTYLGMVSRNGREITVAQP